MDEIINKETAKKLMEIKGEIRGMDLKSDANFVIKERGKEILNKVEEELKEVGYPVEYEKLETMGFYPGGLRALSLLAVKKPLILMMKKLGKWGDMP